MTVDEYIPAPAAAESEEIRLLQEIADRTKREADRTHWIMIFLAGIFLIVLAAALILVPRTVRTLRSAETMIADTDSFIRNTNDFIEANTQDLMDTVSAAQTAIEEVNGLVEANAGTLTDTVTRISEIDFEGLNQSIQDLKTIIEPIASLFGRR